MGKSRVVEQPTIDDRESQLLAHVLGHSRQLRSATRNDQPADLLLAARITLLGLEGARTEAEKRARRAVEALGPYAARSPELSALPFFLLNRES